MKNREKYRDEILKHIKDGTLTVFFKRHVVPHFKVEPTWNMDCTVLFLLWLDEEYQEPEVDWSKVEVDTPILVRDIPEGGWRKAHFAKYEDDTIYAWWDGHTSWTIEGMTEWRYAKLAEEESR